MSNDVESRTYATVENFWGLLKKTEQGYVICIPRIQRDYAQGRTEDLAICQIRDKFVNDLLDSVVNYENGKTLDLNFIYGNIEKNANISRFIPIDGQQRLTTLFLLYWYFAVFSGKIDSGDVKQNLLKFQYETRNETVKFCRNLTEYVRMDLKSLPREKKISDMIRNYYWFFSSFENDSSIKGMLVMIDTIHEKVRNYLDNGISVDHVFDLLISEQAPIRFLYMDINDIGLTDSIYIKMNARGKPLTHFENFKAQLRAYLSEDESFAKEFIDNINGRWSAFFWNPDYRRIIKDPKTSEEIRETVFDNQMMKFFRFVMLMDYITHIEETSLTNNQKQIRDAISGLTRELDYIFTARLFSDGFREAYGLQSKNAILNIDTFHRMNKLLNALSKRQEETKTIVFTTEEEYQKTYIDETSAFLRLIGVSDERTLTYEEQIVLFAEYAFLMKYANKDGSFDKEKELSRWLRLVYNLVKPTLNFQGDVFVGMIRAVYDLVEDGSALECDRYMSRLIRRNYRQSKLFIFTQTQVEEESIKSILMNNDPAWKTAVIDSEKTFMEGQTGALLDFSGLVDLYRNQIKEYEEAHPVAEKLDLDEEAVLAGIDGNSQYYKDFISYLNKFNMLFDQDGVRKEVEEGALFRRALLCYGGEDSYMLPPNKQTRSFLDYSSRDYSFWRLLRDGNNGKRRYLKELLDDIVTDKPICEQLQGIIDHKTFDEEERWKTYFVKISEILECASKCAGSKRDPQGEWVFVIPQRFIRCANNDDILLLTKTQTNSINRELYSYVLFLNTRKQGLAVKYYADYSESAEKYAYYRNNQDEDIHVVYKKIQDVGYRFVAKKADNSEMACYASMEDMLEYIKETIKQ